MAGLKIRLQAGEETAGDVAEKQTPKALASADKQRIATTSLFVSMAERTARSLLSNAISDYGRISGNTIAQKNLQNAMSVLNDVESMGIAIATGNPAIVAVTAIGIGVNNGIKAINYAISTDMESKQSAFMRERTGNSLVDGSRNTYE